MISSGKQNNTGLTDHEFGSHSGYAVDIEFRLTIGFFA